MSFLLNRDKRQYVAAGVFMFLVICLLMFLTYIDIPSQNKDLIVSIVSMLVGRSSSAMDKLFGDTDTERDKLIARVDSLERAITIKTAEFDVIKGENDKLMRMLAGRIAVVADVLEDQE
jgi:hypothetical protein